MPAESRSSGTSGLERLNTLPAAAAEVELLACCSSVSWARAVAAGRPYATAGDLVAAGRSAIAQLAWPDVDEALAAHPRIGERAAGTGREAAWSRHEQSGVDEAGTALATELAAANRDYEQRFGRIFLVCATGLSPREILAAARSRIGNDEAAERDVVRTELGRIAALRLERLVGPR